MPLPRTSWAVYFSLSSSVLFSVFFFTPLPCLLSFHPLPLPPLSCRMSPKLMEHHRDRR